MRNKKQITLLFDLSDTITKNYSLYPFLRSNFRHEFSFFDYSLHDINKDKNDYIVIFAKYFGQLNHFEKSDLLAKAKNRYRKVCFFDDLDGTEIQFFEYFNKFDIYFKKQIYADLSFYTNKFIGHKYFVDWYKSKYDFEIETNFKFDGQYKGDVSDLKQIKLAWNIGVGAYFPVNSKALRYIQKIVGRNHFKAFGTQISSLLMGGFPKTIKGENIRNDKCQARFSVNLDRKHIDFQRNLFLKKIESNGLFLSGRIDPKNYEKEIKEVGAVLSPFGFGEICFRDFEAIINGSLLIKPDMSHINTWPNIYQPMETYVPITWDGSNLVERVESVLSNRKLRKKIIENSFTQLSNSYDELDEKIEEFRELVIS